MAWENIPDWAYQITGTLLQALKERDPYTYGHCRRVARNSRLLAKSAGLNEYEQRVTEFSSLFHDLGKLGIPDRILLKPGRLTREEEHLMRIHPVKSAEIIQPLASIPFFKDVMPGVRHHHERIDGAGYPDGVFGNQIPLTARIILIVDTFDAMTTTRPYRKGLPTDLAYKELKLFAGRQFDPSLIRVFLESHKLWGEYDHEITEEFLRPFYKKTA